MTGDKPFIHYSLAPLTVIHDVFQPGGDQLKPIGLWFSVGDGEDGWRAWCEAEDFSIERLSCQTEIVIHSEARLLQLQTATDIDDFTKTFALNNKHGWDLRCIDWTSVAAKYGGILIAPYCWGRRLSNHANWYYAWDCASGCIWKASAIQELRPINTREAA